MSAVFSSLFEGKHREHRSVELRERCFPLPYLPKSSSLCSVAPAAHGAAPSNTASR